MFVSCLIGYGPAVLGDLVRSQPPKEASKVYYDVVRWLQFKSDIITSGDAYELLASALRCPIETQVFFAAQRAAVSLPSPFKQLTTLAAMSWNAWPALLSTMTVRYSSQSVWLSTDTDLDLQIN